ncbi:MAG: secretin N-terminal domain-containing protein, partial [Coraliomargarita sp.]
FPKSNALLITDALLNLQRIESILTEADQAQTIRESIHFIKLDYVQATELQDRIENLIQGPLKAYLEGNTSVTADERSNQLIIITHPSNMPVLQEVIENIDVDAAPLTATEVFQLKQAKAEEVVPIIENIISGQEEGREEDAKVSRDSNTNKKTANKNEQAPVAQNANPTTIASESSSTLQFSNFVGLSADERTNSIVAFGTKSDLKNISDLIEKIDIPLAQVLVEAVITQVFLSDKQTSGISSLGFTYDGATNTFTDIALGTVDGISISDGILDLDNPSDFSLTTAISVNSDDNSESDTRVLSTPRIIVSHNEEGIINVSRSQPIITSSTTFSSSEGNTRDSVEYRDIGLKLTVTPLIGADGTVQLEVEQLIESIVDEVQVNENDQPVIGKREATSTVSIKDGQIIILGGLQENSGGSNQTYFPMVGRLPVIKSIFGPRGKTYERTEIIIFLRPKILRNPAEAGRVSDEYLDIAQENKYIKRYIETESTGDIYIEESNIVKKFESLNDEEPTEPEEESEQEEEPADEKEGRGLLHFNL